MTAPHPDPWRTTAESVAQEAGRLLPFAFALLVALAAWVAWEEIGEPLASVPGSNGYYTLEDASAHIAGNMIPALPVLALIWGLAELCWLLRALARGRLWEPGVTGPIARLGMAVVLAGLLAATAVPLLARGGDPAAIAFSSVNLALIALGVGLMVFERLVRRLVSAANDLRDETQSFI